MSDEREIIVTQADREAAEALWALDPLVKEDFIQAFARHRINALATAPEAVRLAYGLLWHMRIDREDDNLRLASDARAALLTLLGKDEQVDGITRAKATDGRFTGAA